MRRAIYVLMAIASWMVACQSRAAPPPGMSPDPNTAAMPSAPPAPIPPPGTWPGATAPPPPAAAAPGIAAATPPNAPAGPFGALVPGLAPSGATAMPTLPSSAPPDPRACERLQACCVAIAATAALGSVRPQCEQGLFAAAAVRQIGAIGGDDEDNPLRNQDSTACSVAMVAVLQGVSEQIQASHGAIAFPAACSYLGTAPSPGRR